MRMNVPTIKIEVCEYSPERDVVKRNLDGEDAGKNFEGSQKQHEKNDFNGNTTTRKFDLQKEEATRAQPPNYPANSKQRRSSPERIYSTTRPVKTGVKQSTGDSPNRKEYGQQTMKTGEESNTSNLKGPFRKNELPKVAWNRNMARDNRRESLPISIPRNAGNNGPIAALVSPVLLRKYANNNSPVDIPRLRGSTNFSAITARSKVDSKSPEYKDFYPEALFRNSLRSRARLSLDIPSLKVRSSSEERERSHSMGNVHNSEEEKHTQAAKISTEPSKQWRKARAHMLENRLPSARDGKQPKESTGDSLGSFYSPQQKGNIWEQENDTKKKLNMKKARTFNRSKSEGILSSPDENDEFQSLKGTVSLKERLEAIEKRHGIVHHDSIEVKEL